MNISDKTMPKEAKLLSLSNISYHIGQQRILSHIDIDIAVNETVSLIGPNGAGKSTLVKLILGLTDQWPDNVAPKLATWLCAAALCRAAYFTVTRLRFIGASR